MTTVARKTTLQVSSLVLAALGVLVAPLTANAACGKGQQQAFACKTSNNKTVEVCNVGKNATYSFGRDGAKPELFLQHSKKKIKFDRSSGNGSGGSSGYESVTFHVGKTAYEVTGALESGNVTGSVSVRQGERQLAELTCRPGTVKGDLGVLGMQPFWMTE